jgi:hypothetical protein
MNAFNHQGIVTAAYSLDAYNRCITYRLSKEDKDQSGKKENCIEVLTISSPNRDDLVFPKVHSLSPLFYGFCMISRFLMYF